MEPIQFERLVAKIYDGITSCGLLIGASIVWGDWGFILAFLVVFLEEWKNGNNRLSDGTKH